MSELTLYNAALTDADLLVHVLHDADESDERIREHLSDLALTSYTVYEGLALVGGVTVRWPNTLGTGEGEIILLAVASSRRGQGIGKRIVAALLDEARRRSVRVLLVGTGSVSLDNIAFYQKCGFRMSHVRRDYFHYIQPPLVIEGITLRDMIVLECALEDVPVHLVSEEGLP